MRNEGGVGAVLSRATGAAGADGVDGHRLLDTIGLGRRVQRG